MAGVWSTVPWLGLTALLAITVLAVAIDQLRAYRRSGRLDPRCSSTAYILSIASIALVVMATCVGRLAMGSRGEFVNFVPFRTIGAQFSVGGFLAYLNLASNMCLFVPVGYFLSAAFRSSRWGLACSVLVSFGVECFQYASTVGSADVDDVLLNVLGAGVGAVLYRTFGSDPGTRSERAPSGT